MPTELFDLQFSANGSNQIHEPFMVNQLEPFDIFDDTLKRVSLKGPNCDWSGIQDHPASPNTVMCLDSEQFGAVPDLNILMSDLEQSVLAKRNSVVPLPLPPVVVPLPGPPPMARSPSPTPTSTDYSSSASEEPSLSGGDLVVPLAPASARSGVAKPRVKRTKEQRQQRRREKQRIIARNFRKRKKEHLIGLQSEVKRLRRENESLRQEMGRPGGANGPLPQQDTEVNWEALASMVESRDDQGVKQFLQKHGSVGQEDLEPEKDRNTRFQIDLLDKNLQASQLNKMAVLGLCQQADGGPHEMWDVMCSALVLTPKQQELISKNVGDIHKHHRALVHAQDSLVLLRRQTSEAVQAMACITKSVTDQLTPLQQAQHLIWKEKNKACLQMMDCMWTMQSATVRGKVKASSPFQ